MADSRWMMAVDAVARWRITVPATAVPAADCTPTGPVQTVSGNTAEPSQFSGSITVQFAVLQSQCRVNAGQVQRWTRYHCKHLQHPTLLLNHEHGSICYGSGSFDPRWKWPTSSQNPTIAAGGGRQIQSTFSSEN